MTRLGEESPFSAEKIPLQNPTDTSPGYSTSYSHGHRNYKLIVIGLLVVAVVVGGLLLQSQLSINQLRSEVLGLQSEVSRLQSDLSRVQSAQNFTRVFGTITLPAGNTGGDTILFDRQNEDTLSSTIFEDNSYQLFLPSDETYSVQTYYYDATETWTPCGPQPTITPTGASFQADFSC